MEACKYCINTDAAGSVDKYPTAMCETISTSDASSSSSNSSRASMGQQSSELYATAAEAEFQASKVHWSELRSQTRSDAVEQEEQRKQTAASNREVFRNLVENATPGSLFYRIGFFGPRGDIMLMEKIGEGGQAEIYRAQYKDNDIGRREVVVKVFKLEGAPLLDLQRLLPPQIVVDPWNCRDGMQYTCYIHCARLLDDGRFAIEMARYWGDLRKVIDLRMQDNHNQSPPFATSTAYDIIRQIAHGMRELRRRNISHRDLKASNVLVQSYANAKIKCPRHSNEFYSVVADYECSVGVVGTGFWRAPEILRSLKVIWMKPELFSESADVYSFVMTCYEVFTGNMLFHDVCRNDYEAIYSGRVRLEWPRDIDSKMKALLERCSNLEPSKRPTFDEIVDIVRDFWHID